MIQTVKLAKLVLSDINVRTRGEDLIEQFAADQNAESIDLALCEEGIAWGREQMAKSMGAYTAGADQKEAVRAEAKASSKTPKSADSAKKGADNGSRKTTERR